MAIILKSMSVMVALRKESVDRNLPIIRSTVSVISSLSARRAWIEIPWGLQHRHHYLSLSARRAWIEMVRHAHGIGHAQQRVALRKESVDRNIRDLLPGGGIFGRSPQGERG